MTCMLPFVSQLFACCICFWLAQGRRSVRITSSHCLQRCCDKCALQRLMVDRDDNEKRCMRKDALLMYDSHTSPNDRCLLAWERIRMPTWQARGTHIQLPQETEVGPACNVRCICRYSQLHLRSLSRNFIGGNVNTVPALHSQVTVQHLTAFCLALLQYLTGLEVPHAVNRIEHGTDTLYAVQWAERRFSKCFIPWCLASQLQVSKI